MRAREPSSARHGTYLPIRDYGLIGDCHGSALVGSDGSVDWCCLARFDADPVFCRILDAGHGGFLSVTPEGDFSTRRSYLDGTNVLETVFVLTGGELVVTDFMPVGRMPGSGTHNYVDLNAPHWLVRVVEARSGAVNLQVRYRPSRKFGREPMRLKAERNRISTDDGPCLVHDLDVFTVDHECAWTSAKLAAGQRLTIILASAPVEPREALDRVERYRDITIAFWREWIAYCRYRGPHAREVKRSLLAIKLLVYAPSGALVAAPTTSLPEVLGGSRNWDYRYCWLRDAAFALYALAVTGYGGEARRFSQFLPRVCVVTAPNLQIMYGIEAETDLQERILEHLPGYERSRPVRIGNAAFDQRQIDVYGEILEWALLFETLGGEFDEGSRLMLEDLADYVAEHWREPDQGIWEMRAPPRQHVHGKVMSWVALDRAIRLIGKKVSWERQRDQIVTELYTRGGIKEHGHLVQVYDRSPVDAALLLTPLTGIPVDDAVLRDTVAMVEKELRSGDFVFRYRTEDGFDDGEGAFLICSFWLVDAYLCLGKHTEARELFARLLGHSNDLGLYAEQISPAGGLFLGNFPQAYTHLALVSTAAHLQLCQRHGAQALRCSHADRAKLMVGATLGWRAIWAAFKATWRVGRLLPSRRSELSLAADQQGPEQASCQT